MSCLAGSIEQSTIVGSQCNIGGIENNCKSTQAHMIYSQSFQFRYCVSIAASKKHTALRGSHFPLKDKHKIHYIGLSVVTAYIVRICYNDLHMESFSIKCGTSCTNQHNYTRSSCKTFKISISCHCFFLLFHMFYYQYFFVLGVLEASILAKQHVRRWPIG